MTDTESVLQQALTANCGHLVGMDWRFGVTTSNKNLERVGSTFLQLKLSIDRGGGNIHKVHLELTLPQFYKFMGEMEKAKANLELLW
mmetsp:Transcript_30308/g.33862  ORF Transcript_30308/g.33862 Transcript_30308/m.33862 type:complete len:87 (-) Transcript_30308:185-445(-)